MEAVGSPACGQLVEINDSKDVTWYLKISQLALALAIIHSKPPDKSSKEYTEHLAKIVSGSDSKWKSKVEALEAEVLRLRQQLHLSKLSSRFCLENRNSAVIGETVLSTNTEDCAENFEDSGCDVSSNCIADTLENFLTSTQSDCGSSSSTSVVPSKAHAILTPCHVFKTVSLVTHMQFLQRFLELRNLTEAGGLRTDLKKLGRDCYKVSDSLSQLVDGLVTSYSLPELPFSIFLKQTILVITKLLSDADLSSQILGMCFRKLEDSIKRLVAIVLNNSNLNRLNSVVNIFAINHAVYSDEALRNGADITTLGASSNKPPVETPLNDHLYYHSCFQNHIVNIGHSPLDLLYLFVISDIVNLLGVFCIFINCDTLYT